MTDIAMPNDGTREETHKDEVAAAVVERVKGAVAADSHGQTVVHVPRDTWREAVQFLKDEQQFTQCSDLTAVDQLLRPDRRPPAGVAGGTVAGGGQFPSPPRHPPVP